MPIEVVGLGPGRALCNVASSRKSGGTLRAEGVELHDSVHSRNQCWDSLLVGVELPAKGLPQEALFTLNPDMRSRKKYRDRDRQLFPLRHGQSGSQQHPEHAGIDRIPHETIRAVLNKIVSLYQPRGESPLFSQLPRRGVYQTHRTYRDRQSDHPNPPCEYGRLDPRRRQRFSAHRIKPEQKVGYRLHQQSEERTPIAFCLLNFGRMFLQPERQGKQPPANDDPIESQLLS
jgi:hypothetical protein